jgi:hypothetical protein
MEETMTSATKSRRPPAKKAPFTLNLPSPGEPIQAPNGGQAGHGQQEQPAPSAEPEASASGTQGKSYEVGYGKPPLSSRFKKGQSGNPRGRRKKLPTPEEAAARLMQGKVTVSENGVTKTITRSDALILQMFKAACKGSTRAMAMLTQMLRQYALDTASKPEPWVLEILTIEELESLLSVKEKIDKHAFKRDLEKLKAKHGVRGEDVKE